VSKAELGVRDQVKIQQEKLTPMCNVFVFLGTNLKAEASALDILTLGLNLTCDVTLTLRALA
jgi:hypothetical protein